MMTVLVQKTLTNVLSGLLGKNKVLQNSKRTHTAQKTAVPRQVKMYKHIHKDETQQIKMRICERGTFS